MVTRYHGCEATLGCSLQRDLGSDILDGHDDTVGVAGPWFSRIQQIRWVQADVREGEEDEQPSHVLRDFRNNDVMHRSRVALKLWTRNRRKCFAVREKLCTGRFGVCYYW